MAGTGTRYNHPLKKCIQAMGLTQEEFAIKCGLSRSTIGNIIAGRSRSKGIYNSDPRHYETICAIAIVLKVSHRTAERICNGEEIY